MSAADQAAHVPEDQELACTSFTGELPDLLRKGIEGGRETLTLDDIYRELRPRLGEVALPDPNRGVTDTAGTFPFSRNAAYRQGPPILRFPQGAAPALTELPPSAAAPAAEQVSVPAQEPESVRPRRRWRMWGVIAVTAILLIGGGAYAVKRLDASSSTCPSPGSPASPGGTVTIGSDSSTPEDQLIADIYRDALQGNDVQVDPNIGTSPREIYYGQVCLGDITIVPEYNGTLLTTSVDPDSSATTTAEVDQALDRQLPPSLEILNPGPAQDKDSVTVTKATAARYHLKSIADLRRVASRLALGAAQEFEGREQGTTGLKEEYGVAFGSFFPLDYAHNPRAPVTALMQGKVQAADVYTTSPAIKADHLVVLADPKDLFRAENVVPLVYKPALQANPSIAVVLNYVSLRLTQSQLLELNVKAAQPHANLSAIASDWTRANAPKS